MDKITSYDTFFNRWKCIVNLIAFTFATLMCKSKNITKTSIRFSPFIAEDNLSRRWQLMYISHSYPHIQQVRAYAFFFKKNLVIQPVWLITSQHIPCLTIMSSKIILECDMKNEYFNWFVCTRLNAVKHLSVCLGTKNGQDIDRSSFSHRNSL